MAPHNQARPKPESESESLNPTAILTKKFLLEKRQDWTTMTLSLTDEAHW